MLKIAHCIAFVAILMALCLTSTLPCLAQGEVMHNNNPTLTGSADSPKTVNKGAVFTYAITLTEGDTWRNVQTSELTVRVDTTCTNTLVQMNSMSNHILGLRGVNGTTYTYTWDVTGNAVATAGFYLDKWKLDDGYTRRMSSTTIAWKSSRQWSCNNKQSCLAQMTNYALNLVDKLDEGSGL